ncbi:uncharacterized protein RHOBADRAFT_52938 [Rhodotorula graminis WP1]|uniref:F-box domain-containing protein n=1 Tax=Rhodotorula graminis (strain WP1) TaxID=578459 RepID=A0A194S5B8_RHOGW|nr:uncharacterized protein RHOBADRAFT_52938 [Rhodotorula graminis WP1]KPV75928.1 hypothetical protein RHOBADRAFT_52938 [Rhodotorula graminis WP1]
MTLIPTGHEQSPPDNLAQPPAVDFPHEILCFILHLCVPPSGHTKAEIRRRRRALYRYAHVNSRWHAAAFDQAVRSVFINAHANGWSQDEATATRWVTEAKEHADSRGRGIRELVLFGEKHLPDQSLQAMFQQFDQLEHLVVVKSRNPRSLLGSTTIRHLQVLETASPSFLGIYSNLRRLDIIGCRGEALPSTLTNANFPSLDTLVLDLLAPRRGIQIKTYQGRGVTDSVRPPNVRALALRGQGHPFLREVLAFQTRLEHLYLGVPRAETFDYLHALPCPISSLWVEHTVEEQAEDHAALLPWQPHLAPALSATAFDHTSLKRIGLAYYDSPDQAVDLLDDWLISFASAVAKAMALRGLDLDVRWATPACVLEEWDPLRQEEPARFLGLGIRG